MIVLPAGTPKYLLLIPSEIDRNFQRKTTGGPIAFVAEPDPYYGFRLTPAYGVLADGPVALGYNQTGVLVESREPYTNKRTEHRAAYMTTGRVAIAESREEAESLQLSAAEVPPEVAAEDNPPPELTAAPTKKETKKANGKAE